MGGVWKNMILKKKGKTSRSDVVTSSLELYFFSVQAIENITNTMTETSSISS